MYDKADVDVGDDAEPNITNNQEQTSRGLFSSIHDAVENVVDDAVDAFQEKAEDIGINIDIGGMRRAGSSCHQNALETTELCNETVQKAREMVDFGLEIKATLTNLGGNNNMDVSALATIKDLIGGNQMKAAMSLAGEMDDLALRCVEKSNAMIKSMNDAVVALPDALEEHIEDKVDAAQNKGAREGDPELPDIQPDIEELGRCVTAIEEVNLVTVFDAGVNAFDGLTSKGEICRTMFSTIKDFAVDIVEMTQVLKEFKIHKFVGKVKDLVRDIWRCLRLGDLIKAFALQVGKLVKWIIDLFKICNERLSMIWGALAYAKDVMADVVQYILEAMGLCDTAKEKSDKILETSREISGHMGNMGNFNASTMKSLKDLMDGDEIKSMIDLAMSMDDIVLEAVQKIITMIQKVTEAFGNIPEVITEGISDMSEAGKADEDPDPADATEDVKELDANKSDIEAANPFQIIQASRAGISNVESKVLKTRDMIQQSRGFAESCNGNIDDFMGSWDLQKAMQKLIEMCRLVKLGEMLKQFAEQIRRVVKAVLDMLRALRDKIMNIDLVPDALEDAIQEASKYCGKSCAVL
mmetsp:Transcript_25800/g.38944  ORF Transcript_25800/g.38944 Transcript_25800/m.38944 type:complete len:582 (+) Transcript_25800:90-1835(+)|eukprot:CAMPEP_0194219732 /NCGR_PEP_ID=MMETSP0156-20130528/26713_1 /TAXON_ID=33649 /ORGANISM="Thalassionema nitzschioides, Strain L26-B" /LENGTH=581 /DNA_ID=CAMNT_0038949517 /DNA_START=33 /DNA_END=1778 /DNA_ORIENTATION=+